MSYVTRGNIQIELKTGNEDVVIKINPVQGYAVKHEKEDWTVFIKDDPKAQSLDARVFKTTQSFTTAKDSCFIQALVSAALQQTVIEIRIKEPNSQKIESIKLPGTLGSDKA
jgi:hypothetical protein